MKRYNVQSVQQFPTYQLVTLEPVSETDRLSFWPGQYATLGFKRGSRLSPMRCFSMVSSPNDDTLQFAMRSNGAFTRQVARLSTGDSVRVQGPFGNFVLDPSDKNIIMMAGGIGITPYLSMIRTLTETGDPTPVTLLYACRDTNDIPFYDELRQLQQRNRNLRVAFIVKHGASDVNRGIYAGRIDENLLQKVTSGRFQNFSYFICGPQRFMDSLTGFLDEQAVDSSRIVTESFTESTKFGWHLKSLSIPSLTYLATGFVMVIGIGMVMAVDLFGYLPKTQKASAATQGSTSSSTSSTSNTANNTSYSQSNTTASTPTTSNTNTQTYYAPVSTVS